MKVNAVKLGTTTKILRLEEPLPCSIYDPAKDSVCGNPATVCYAYEVEQNFPMGCWMVQPVCAHCALRTAAIYADR